MFSCRLTLSARCPVRVRVFFAQLSHALSSWAEHVDLVQGETIDSLLEQRDLYARQTLKALPQQQQADLLAWAEAHTVLSFIAKDGLLERFGSHAPASWSALCALGAAAKRAGCAAESPYALLTDGEALRSLVADSAPAASKLMRLLPWVANPLAAVSTKGATRLRTAEKAADGDGDRLRLVRVRFDGESWERQIDWDDIALVHEPSPGRDRSSGNRPIPGVYFLAGGL